MNEIISICTTHNKNGHKAGQSCVPVPIRGRFTNQDTIEYEVPETQLHPS